MKESSVHRRVERLVAIEGRVFRFALAFTAVSVLFLASTAVTLAGDGNWGAGSFNTINPECATNEWSECTADDSSHYVFVDANIPSALENSIGLTLTYDYNPIADFSATQNAALLSYTDVRVKIATMPGDFQYWLFTTCASDASYGGGNGYYRWCKKQVMKVDPAGPKAQSSLNDWNYMQWLACHEIGHTTGLQHVGPVLSRELVAGRRVAGPAVMHEVRRVHLQPRRDRQGVPERLLPAS